MLSRVMLSFFMFDSRNWPSKYKRIGSELTSFSILLNLKEVLASRYCNPMIMISATVPSARVTVANIMEESVDPNVIVTTTSNALILESVRFPEILIKRKSAKYAMTEQMATRCKLPQSVKNISSISTEFISEYYLCVLVLTINSGNSA